MNVYTYASLLDVAGALEALPELLLEGAVEPTSRRHTAGPYAARRAEQDGLDIGGR